MKPELIRHVRDLVGLIGLFRDDLHVSILRFVEVNSRPCVACLGKAAFEDFHDAVGIGMTIACQQSS